MKRNIRLFTCAIIGGFLSVTYPSFAYAQAIDEKKSVEHQHHGAELSAEQFSADSLYQLQSQWKTNLDNRFVFGSQKGQTNIVSMFYTTCTAVCPVLVQNLKRIERHLANVGIPKPHFILVTFDPVRDTEKILNRYAKQHVLTPDGWTLLRGSEEDTLELSVLLGMKYRADGSSGFSHSNIISVLDEDGKIIHQHIGIKLSDADISEISSALMQKKLE